MDPAREHAMREAFTEVFRLREAMAASGNAPESDAEIERLGTQADAISQPWETGADAAEWDWLNAIADDWRVAPEAMRRQMDTVRHDLRAGLTPFTPLQARSMDQAGTLIDSLYRQQTRWRAEHLADMAEYSRVDARLESPGITTSDRHTLMQARTQIRDARSAGAEAWSAERRVWERHGNTVSTRPTGKKNGKRTARRMPPRLTGSPLRTKPTTPQRTRIPASTERASVSCSTPPRHPNKSPHPRIHSPIPRTRRSRPPRWASTNHITEPSMNSIEPSRTATPATEIPHSARPPHIPGAHQAHAGTSTTCLGETAHRHSPPAGRGPQCPRWSRGRATARAGQLAHARTRRGRRFARVLPVNVVEPLTSGAQRHCHV